MAQCHPEKPHQARGFCKACYLRWLQENNPRWAAEYQSRQREYPWNWRRVHPQYIQEWRRTHPYAGAKHRYGITEDEYHKMAAEQKQRCRICGRTPKTLTIDHNHETGKVRGLLCRRCNLVVGILENKNTNMPAILAYLESYRK
ncbi:MAG: endonuclease domain-containing protein [Candidatus Bathyarchaeia archaeon]